MKVKAKPAAQRNTKRAAQRNVKPAAQAEAAAAAAAVAPEMVAPAVEAQPGVNGKVDEIAPVQRIEYSFEQGALPVSLQSNVILDDDLVLFWDGIRDTKKNFFRRYVSVMEQIFDCGTIDASNHPKYGPEYNPQMTERFIAKNKIPFTSGQAYSLLKYATEKYVHRLLGAYDGAWAPLSFPPTDAGGYIDQIIDGNMSEYVWEAECNNGLGVIRRPILVELIWSYWLEEGRLVQTMGAISNRFQNIRSRRPDPLAHLMLDPLRPMNNLLWGYIQDTQHRLNVQRRVYEYDHHYGLKLVGTPIGPINSVDSRSKFMGAFNNLLHECACVYRQVDDNTITADAFPVLNALRELHALLAEGADNQFGDLPTTAKIEMLIEQFLLARPEIRDFLGGRPMVQYQEPWMDRVDTMKTLQGWTNTSITQFYELATYGELILLTIRWGGWSNLDDATIALQWAVHWRNEIQRYIHSYRTVTGVDLSANSLTVKNVADLLPSVLIRSRRQMLNRIT